MHGGHTYKFKTQLHAGWTQLPPLCTSQELNKTTPTTKYVYGKNTIIYFNHHQDLGSLQHHNKHHQQVGDNII